MSNELARYQAEGGAEVVLTRDAITNALLRGQSNVTDGELTLFVELCKAKKMNPFEGDCYLIKYGNNPAQMVTGKGYFVKRAEANPNCEGWEAGVYVKTPKGEFKEREGSMVCAGEVVIGGWAKVYRKGWRVPIKETVAFSEYNTGKSMWAKMGGTMIRKVALCHALREAFPNEFSGLYSEEEMDQAKPAVTDEDLPPVINWKRELVRACTDYANRFGLDPKEVMAEQVLRSDYKAAKDSGDADVLDLWYAKVSEELDAIEEIEAITEEADSCEFMDYSEYQAPEYYNEDEEF